MQTISQETINLICINNRDEYYFICFVNCWWLLSPTDEVGTHTQFMYVNRMQSGRAQRYVRFRKIAIFAFRWNVIYRESRCGVRLCVCVNEWVVVEQQKRQTHRIETSPKNEKRCTKKMQRHLVAFIFYIHIYCSVVDSRSKACGKCLFRGVERQWIAHVLRAMRNGI